MEGSWLSRAALLATGALVAVQAVVLRGLGRRVAGPHGKLRLWEASTSGPLNSQALLDWYSLTHLVHGFLLHGLTRVASSRPDAKWRLPAAVVAEVGWEVLENSPASIHRYDVNSPTRDYRGDSVANSLADTFCCILGFVAATRLPAAATVGVAAGTEALSLYEIGDNLTLSVFTFVFPVPAIQRWQERYRNGSRE